MPRTSRTRREVVWAIALRFAVFATVAAAGVGGFYLTNGRACLTAACRGSEQSAWSLTSPLGVSALVFCVGVFATVLCAVGWARSMYPSAQRV